MGGMECFPCSCLWEPILKVIADLIKTQGVFGYLAIAIVYNDHQLPGICFPPIHNQAVISDSGGHLHPVNVDLCLLRLLEITSKD